MAHIDYKSAGSQQFDFNIYAIHQLQEIRIWTLLQGIFGLALILFGFSAIFWNLSPNLTETEIYKVFVKIPILGFGALVLILPGYYLLRFSILSGKALRNRDAITLGRALSCQKKYYRAVGLLITAGVIMFLLLEVWALQPNSRL